MYRDGRVRRQYVAEADTIGSAGRNRESQRGTAASEAQARVGDRRRAGTPAGDPRRRVHPAQSCRFPRRSHDAQSQDLARLETPETTSTEDRDESEPETLVNSIG